jgi:hypothetical protein
MYDPNPKLINQEKLIIFYEIFPRLHRHLHQHLQKLLSVNCIYILGVAFNK